MSQLIPIAANFVAIFVLIFAVYFPRHRRRDMIVAYLAIDTGVLAIAAYSLYGFKTSLAGRSLFRDRILQERSV